MNGYPSSGLPAAPEQATASDSAALPGRLEVQEEGPATLLLLVMQGRNPALQRRSRIYCRVAALSKQLREAGSLAFCRHAAAFISRSGT